MQPKDRQRETGDGQLSFLKSAGMHLQVHKYPMIGRAKCAKDLCRMDNSGHNQNEWVADIRQEEKEEHSGQRI